MGYRHDEASILDAACLVVAEDGLSALTYRAVGARAGIPDRTVVYYFPTKDALTAAVLARTGEDLVRLVTRPRAGRVAPERLLADAWSALACPEGDRAFRLLVEVAARAVRGVEPHTASAAVLLRTWVGWVADQLDVATADRADVAAGLVATVDGLMLLRTAAGPDVADRAARGLGIGA